MFCDSTVAELPPHADDPRTDAEDQERSGDPLDLLTMSHLQRAQAPPLFCPKIHGAFADSGFR